MPPPLSRGATGEEAAPMDIARSDGVVLLDVDREALGAGQLFAGGDLHVLIGDNAIQLHVGLDHGILHQDTVLDHSTLLDLDAAEQHAVLHGAVPSMTQPSARMEFETLEPVT